MSRGGKDGGSFYHWTRPGEPHLSSIPGAQIFLGQVTMTFEKKSATLRGGSLGWSREELKVIKQKLKILGNLRFLYLYLF